MRAPLPTDIQALGQTPLFDGCPPRVLRAVQRYGTTIDAVGGRALGTTNSSNELVIVVAGSVTVYSDGEPRRLYAGDWFGSYPGSCTGAGMLDELAVVTQAATLFVVHHREYSDLCRAWPPIALRLAGMRARAVRDEPLPEYVEPHPAMTLPLVSPWRVGSFH